MLLPLPRPQQSHEGGATVPVQTLLTLKLVNNLLHLHVIELESCGCYFHVLYQTDRTNDLAVLFRVNFIIY